MSSANPAFHKLTGGDLNDATDATTLSIKLDRHDLDEITRKQIGISEAYSYLTAEFATVVDMSQRAMPAVENGVNALKVSTWAKDITGPSLEWFDLDMHAAKLRLYFSETVYSDDLVVTDVVLHSLVGGISRTSYQLTSSSKVVSANSYVVEIDLGLVDMNELRKNRNLAVSNETTFLAFNSTLVADMFDNDVTAVAMAENKGVRNFTRDLVAPVLDRFNLNIPLQLLR
jgi:hypothetical protein